MYNGVSALKATQKGMDTIGNNIANANTTGYKASSLTFADLLSEQVKMSTGPTATTGGTNGMQIGLGVRVGSIDVNTNQGGLNATGESSDLAIQGNGYFMVGSGTDDPVYTRDGHLAVDSSGNLVSAATGQHILGWQADDTGAIDTTGKISNTSTLQIPVGSLTCAHATTNVKFTGNVDASSATGATCTTDIVVYDSIGQKHNIHLQLTRQPDATNPAIAGNTWNWVASGDPTLAPPAGTSNMGTITFGNNGHATAITGGLLMNPTGGATTPQNIAIDMGQATQLAGESTFQSELQDGFPIGTLQSFTVDKDGLIQGMFSNGLTRSLGQLAMATFSNSKALKRIGDNQFSLSMNSGAPVVSTANSQGAGSIQSGYLEQSNVDLSTELTNMIVQQRTYQANTKIVTAVDDLLESLINMKR
jgi:flagellar hook protein FlgE